MKKETKRGKWRKRGGKRALDRRKMVLTIGDYLLGVLHSTKHLGVIEKTHVALKVLCKRLLLLPLPCSTTSASSTIAPASSARPHHGNVVEGWLHQLLTEVGNTAESSENWLRRSAGIPFCLMAILQADPAQRESLLLARTLQTLLEVVVFFFVAVSKPIVPTRFTEARCLGRRAIPVVAVPCARVELHARDLS